MHLDMNGWKISCTKPHKYAYTDSFGSYLTITNSFGNVAHAIQKNLECHCCHLCSTIHEHYFSVVLTPVRMSDMHASDCYWNFGVKYSVTIT